MKVDIGTCALCGAKNSKFVETCYKCGAPLPWAPNYSANSPQPSKPAPVVPTPTTPKPVPPAIDATTTPPTVVAPSFDQNAFDRGGTKNPWATAANRPITVPTWAVGAGVLGSVLFGFLLGRVFSGSAPQPAPVVVPVTEPTVVPTPVVANVPTLAPTVAPAATVLPTDVPAPPATPAAPAAPTAAPNPPPVTANLNFENVLASTHQGTPDQQRSFWATAVGGKVNWRGTFVSAGNSPTGPVVVRCGTGTDVANVTVNLDPAGNPLTSGFQSNQVLNVSGDLQSYGPNAFVLDKGTVTP